MKKLASLCALLAILIHGGCATKPAGGEQGPASGKQAIYKKMLRGIGPGMTRRQLYAVLPPASQPVASKPVLIARSGGLVARCSESYPVDGEFLVEVDYELADGSKYMLQEHATSDDILRTQDTPGYQGMVSGQNPDDKIISRPVLRKVAQ